MTTNNVPRSASGFNSALSSTNSLSQLVITDAMTRALVDLTAAERDLGDDGDFDPALSAYHAAVAKTRADVLGHSEALIAQPPTTPQTVSLQRVAVLVDTVIRSGDPVEVARIRAGLDVARWVWQVPANLPNYSFYNATLDAALDALGSYIDGSDDPQDTPPTAGPHMVTETAPSPVADHPVPVAHTPVSFAFTALLRNLDTCVAAERRIQRDVVGDDVFAPQFASDLAASEAAHEGLHARLVKVTALPERRNLDRPLRLLAKALHALLSMEDDGDRQHMHAAMARSVDILLVQGDAPADRPVRALQLRFFARVAELMSMEDYGGPGAGPEDDGTDDAPRLAA